MKVLHATHGYFPESSGGVETYVREIARAQRERGAEVVLLAGSLEMWPRCGVEEIEVAGDRVLRVHRDDRFFDWHAKSWHPGVERIVDDVLARERPDVLHVHHWIRLTCNLVEIAARRGVPAVVTLHDAYTSCPRAFRVDRDGAACARELSIAACAPCVPRYEHQPRAEIEESIALHRDSYRAELARAGAVIVSSPATARLIADSLDLDATGFAQLPMAYRRRFPGRLRPPPRSGVLRFACWGNQAPHKGTRHLVKAFARLAREALPRPVELHVVGEFATEAFEREVRAAADGAPVRFHGRFEAAQLVAVQPHVAVLPALAFETFGYVLQEAFELGLPCIVSDAGVLAERAGPAALVVPAGDEEALAEAMRRLAADPDRLEAMAAAAPPPPPDPDEHVARLLEIYRAACAAPPRSSVPWVDPSRRAAFSIDQRESALRGLYGDRGPQ